MSDDVQQKPRNGAATTASSDEQVLPTHPAIVVTFVQMQSRSSIGQVVSTQVTAHGGYPVGTCAATRWAVRTSAAMEKNFIILWLKKSVLDVKR